MPKPKKLGIPVIAVLDTNCNPENIDFPIPGNDDATRAIDLYCNLIADAVLEGIQQELSSQGVDVGAMEAPVEEIPVVAEEAPAQEAPAEDVKAEEVPASEEKTEEKSS